VVERGEKGGVQILQRFASGFPRIFQAKRDKEAVVLLLHCRGKKKRWLAKTWVTWSVCK
jgi:hypothetical protein